MKEIQILGNDKLIWKLIPVNETEESSQVWWAQYDYTKGWLQK